MVLDADLLNTVCRNVFFFSFFFAVLKLFPFLDKANKRIAMGSLMVSYVNSPGTINIVHTGFSQPSFVLQD